MTGTHVAVEGDRDRAERTGARPLPGLLLAPEPTAAAIARRHLRAVLGPAGLVDVQDDALLVISELVTNAVVHAATPVDVRLEVTALGALRLEVRDRLAGVPPVVRGSDAAREGGRGVFLLDALAGSWGTTFRRDGKSVWCVLGPAAPEPEPAGRAGGPVPVPDLSWVLRLRADLEERLPVPLVLSELLHRLCDALDVDRASILASSASGTGWETWAVRGADPTGAEMVRAERLSRSGSVRVLEAPDVLLLPLRARTGLLGALQLETGRILSETEQAVARIVADRAALLVAGELAESQRQRDRGALSLLAEASEMFAGGLDVQLAATLATQLVVPRFGAWAALLSFQEHGPRLDAVTCADEEQVSLLRLALSSRAGAALATTLRPALAALQPVVLPVDPVLGEHGHHLLAVPLVARRRLLGALLVGRVDRRHTSEETGLLLDLARRAALATDNARLYEDRSAVAKALQASLLPASLPTTSRVDFGARYAAAGEGNEVGGDFYDVFDLPGDAHALAIGDVCGKGPEAAAITGLARQVLRLSLRDGHLAPSAYERLNSAIVELGDGGRFLTSALAIVRPCDDGLRVTISSAGHPLPVLRRADGSCAFVGRAGQLLGVLPTVEVHEDVVDLRPGDSLVFYTDGVTERREGDLQFGDEELLRVLQDPDPLDATSLAARLEAEVHAFGRSSPRDDLAVLVVQAPRRAVVRGGGAPAGSLVPGQASVRRAWNAR